ncbi:MAG TPA: protein translocase SEC61 complex subunit gamma [Nitrososphaera sp.]|nr:protein translocase SEC61 complex subunit gamma [Nitrososphaera sp.]
MSRIQRRVSEMVQTLRLAKKTSKDDYLQHLRLVALGLIAVGGIAFVIKLIAEYVTFGTGGRFG